MQGQALCSEVAQGCWLDSLSKWGCGMGFLALWALWPSVPAGWDRKLCSVVCVAVNLRPCPSGVAVWLPDWGPTSGSTANRPLWPDQATGPTLQMGTAAGWSLCRGSLQAGPCSAKTRIPCLLCLCLAPSGPCGARSA